MAAEAMFGITPVKVPIILPRPKSTAASATLGGGG
jgi:hypothetical protein